MDNSLRSGFPACDQTFTDAADLIHSRLQELHCALADRKSRETFSEAKVSYNPELGTFAIEMPTKSPVFDWVHSNTQRAVFGGNTKHSVTQIAPKRCETFTMFLMPHEADKITAAVDNTLLSRDKQKAPAPSASFATPHDACFKYL